MRFSELAAIAALGASACLTGCAAYDYGPYADMDYEGFYDDHYGPFYGGYWGPEDYFYYWDRSSQRYRRDDGHHFQRHGADGFHPVHGRSPPMNSAHVGGPTHGQGH